MNSKPKAALVLSGGGSLGVAHVGALRVLETKYNFEYYSGVSAGAIVAAAHSIGKSAEEISELILNQNFFSLAFDFSHSNFGILRGKKIKKLLDETFKEKTFADLKKSGKTLRIYATNFQNGERVEISSGKISDAVMASLSVPILFEPHQYNGIWLVDGGLTGNFPMQETMQKYKGEKIIGIDVATSIHKDKDFSHNTIFGKISGMQSALERTFRIFFKTQNNYNISDKRLKIYTPKLEEFKTIDITKLKEIETAGEECCKQD